VARPDGGSPSEACLRPLTTWELATVANTGAHMKEELGVTHTADLTRISADRRLIP
jgi:hypothetical protein